MNETMKTATYGAVALVAAVVAALSIPPERQNTAEIADDRFENGLFPKLESAGDAQGLRIVQPDEKGGKAKDFRVTQQQGRWVIATRDGYPADLKDQIKNAATAFVGLKPLPQIATDQTGDHANYGVVAPGGDKSAASDKDTGTLVELLKANGDPLASLIIGKRVEGSTDQRFVRVPGEARVYTAKISLEKFSTKFEDWIEKDLLQLKAAEVDRFAIKDYVPDVIVDEFGKPHPIVLPRAEISLQFDDKEYKWTLEKLTRFGKQGATTGKLLDNEEINSQRVDEAKNALADLKIVEVSRKPKALAAMIRDKRTPLDAESQLSLVEKGFAVPDESGSLALVSVNGDVEVQSKDGVQYLLRFGNIAGAQQGSASDKLNRYLMVSAQVNPAKFPSPQLKPVPDLPASVEKPGAATKAEPKKDDAKKPGEPPAAPDKNAERDRVIKENERLTNEWKEQKLKADQRVEELNDRFADWYFVVSEDGFKKVRFSLQDIVKEKEKEEGYLVDSFRKLEKEGLKKAKTAEPPPGFGRGGPGPGGFELPQ